MRGLTYKAAVSHFASRFPTDLLGRSECCLVKHSNHPCKDTLPITLAMLPNVLVHVEQAQLVPRPRGLPLDCRHRSRISISEDYLRFATSVTDAHYGQESETMWEACTTRYPCTA